MRSLKLTLAYDGTDFSGWQVQPGERTVQDTLQRALRKITGEPIAAVASGRTDSGVHALGQAVGFRTQSELSPEVFLRALNAELPADLAVLRAEEAAPDFHAIRDCVSKRYRYLLHDGPLPDPLDRLRHWKVWTPLDERPMQSAAQSLVGTHDFRSFQSSGAERKSSVRTVQELSVQRGFHDSDATIAVEIEADGFLYNMVRAIVGALVEIGRGARDEAWLKEVLHARDRASAAVTAPPQGLYLLRVDY